MATLHASALVSYSIGILRRPSAGVLAPSVMCITPRCPNSNTRLDLRSRTEVIMHVKNRWSPVFASKSNPSDEKNTSDDAPSGPPFLTLLAGVVVFLFVCWIIVSIATWLISLILHPPPLN